MPNHGKRKIVITGGARGIGRATARYLALQGHQLFLIDADGEELRHTAALHIPECLAESAAPRPHQEVGYRASNLREPSEIQEAVAAAAGFFGGRIDVLVNNAGIARAMWSENRTMEDHSVLDEWNACVETNLTAPFLASQACIPFMRRDPRGRGRKDTTSDLAVAGPEAAAAASGEKTRRTDEDDGGPSIINISSFRAHQSEANCEGYAAAKAGLLGLTHAMAVSGGQWGVRCNAILPGYINTTHESREGDELEQLWLQGVDRARHPVVGRIGKGEDIAKTVEWLMDAGFVNGQEIVVDGGVSKIKHSSS